MSHFNEGEKAKEERRKYQKTAQVLTLFIVSYIAQWVTWIVYCIWSFVTPPPIIMVSFPTAFLKKKRKRKRNRTKDLRETELNTPCMLKDSTWQLHVFGFFCRLILWLALQTREECSISPLTRSYDVLHHLINNNVEETNTTQRHLLQEQRLHLPRDTLLFAIMINVQGLKRVRFFHSNELEENIVQYQIATVPQKSM